MTANVLALHIDAPGKPHRLLALDPQRIRCIDCCHTIVLPVVAGSTSTSQPLRKDDPEVCAEHAGQRALSCGPCRSERLEIGASA